tara:strand:+ start:1361 stop:1939 length:579 start_codon:yes stop_codon:yes gene_type:complete
MTKLNVTEGDLVSVHYVGTLEDGSIFDSSREREQPIIFKAGSEELIPEFSKSVIGMSLGQVKFITVDAAGAFGDVNDDLFRQVPVEQFGDNPIPDVGEQVTFQNNDNQIIGLVHLVEDDKVIVDFNHPMAGKKLNFEIEVVNFSVVKPDIDFSTMTLKELKAHAKEAGVKGYSKMKKADIIILIQNKGDQVG